LSNSTGATPMHTAAYHGHLEIVKYLREKGAKADAEQSNKWTPLHLGKFNLILMDYF
jgi:ankyrin repeat protein